MHQYDGNYCLILRSFDPVHISEQSVLGVTLDLGLTVDCNTF